MNRPHETEKALDPHIAQWVVRLWTAFGAVYALFIGVSILLGGQNRFAAPAYQIALKVPGAPWTWGVIILVSGIVLSVGIMLGKTRITAAGAFLAMFWSLMFSVPFAVALVKTETANGTGVWSYLYIAVGFMLTAGAHYAQQPVDWRRLLHRKAHR